MVSNRERILRELYKKREGLGHNDLRQIIHEKSLRRWLPELKKENLIEIKKVKVKGGRKHVHKLTLDGIAYVQRNLLCESFLSQLLELYETHPPNIDIVSEFAQNMLDEIYGKDKVVVVCMTKSEYSDYQECLKKKIAKGVIWKRINKKENKKAELG